MKNVLRQLVVRKDDALAFEDFRLELEANCQRTFKTELRQFERVELPPIPVEVQPMADNLQPSGQPFAAILRNISESGIGIMFGKDVSARFVEISVPISSDREIKTLLEVEHSTENGMLIGGTPAKQR